MNIRHPRKLIVLTSCLTVGIFWLNMQFDFRGSSKDPQFSGAVSDAPKNLVSVPYIGCATSSMTGERTAAPQGSEAWLLMDAGTAQQLAYYTSDDATVIIGPRDWSCQASLGSAGSRLSASPVGDVPASSDEETDTRIADGVYWAFSTGQTSGRFAVADAIARFFPERHSYVRSVVAEGLVPLSSFPNGPGEGVSIVRKSSDYVVYRETATSDQEGDAWGLIMLHGVQTGDCLQSFDACDVEEFVVKLPRSYGNLGPQLLRQYQLFNDPTTIDPDTRAPQETIFAFYGALRRGLGDVAAQFIVPEKRAMPAYKPENLSRFYGQMAQPISLKQLRQDAPDRFYVRYTFRLRSGRACDGAARIQTVKTGQGVLIARIEPLTGC